MPTRTPAIVLRTFDFSESSQVVVLLGRGTGKIKGLAKGCRRASPSAQAQFSGGFELLTCGEILFKAKPGLELSAITEWNLLDDRHALRADWRAQNLGFFAAECTGASLAEGDPHPALYDALETFLQALVREREHQAPLLIFLTALLRETGHPPRLHTNASGNPLPDLPVCAFDPASGGLVPTAASPEWRVRRETVLALRAADLGESLAAFDHDTLHRGARLLTAWLRYLLGLELPTMKLVL